MPYFSILVPVYNQEGKMDKFIESIKNQTFKDFEVIIVDDGSTDCSKEIIKQLEKEDSRIRVVEHEENKSLLWARWTAMQYINGKYVLFLDSDDSIVDDCLEKIYNRLQNNEVDMLRYGFVFIHGGREVIPQELGMSSLEAMLRGIIPPCVWKNCYKAEVIKKVYETIKPFRCNMGEDSFYSTAILSFVKTEDFISDILYLYDEGTGMTSKESNLTKERLRKAIIDLRNSGDNFKKYVNENIPKYNELADKAAKRIIRFLVIQYVFYVEDWEKCFDFMNVFREEKCDDAFSYGVNRIFEMKVRKKMGEEVKINFDLT